MAIGREEAHPCPPLGLVLPVAAAAPGVLGPTMIGTRSWRWRSSPCPPALPRLMFAHAPGLCPPSSMMIQHCLLPVRIGQRGVRGSSRGWPMRGAGAAILRRRRILLIGRRDRGRREGRRSGVRRSLDGGVSQTQPSPTNRIGRKARLPCAPAGLCSDGITKVAPWRRRVSVYWRGTEGTKEKAEAADMCAPPPRPPAHARTYSPRLGACGSAACRYCLTGAPGHSCWEVRGV